jgi:hypothetical protein
LLAYSHHNTKLLLRKNVLHPGFAIFNVKSWYKCKNKENKLGYLSVRGE